MAPAPEIVRVPRPSFLGRVACAPLAVLDTPPGPADGGIVVSGAELVLRVVVAVRVVDHRHVLASEDLVAVRHAFRNADRLEIEMAAEDRVREAEARRI